MNAFIRWSAYAAALMFLALLVGGLTFAFMLKKAGVTAPDRLRDLVLTSDEKAFLGTLQERGAKPTPSVEPKRMPEAEETLERLADMVNADRAGQVVEQLRLQRSALDQERTHLDRQWADLQLARADLARLRQQLATQEERMAEQRRLAQAEKATWAEAQATNVRKVQAFDETEKARYKDQAKLFELMKDGAWQSLRQMDAREIARYLTLMDPKKAARMLTLAQQDPELPTIAQAIHQEMLRVDVDGRSGSQTDWLAGLYGLMPAERVLGYMDGSSSEEFADLLLAMGRQGQDKKRAELLTALRTKDDRRELEVQRILAQRGGEKPQ